MSRKKMMKVALFPYDDEMYPYVRCGSMLDGVKIQFLVSPGSWGVENVNVCGYKIRSCLSDEDYSKIDAVWVCDSIGKIMPQDLLGKIDEILAKNKKVIITRHMGREIGEAVESLSKSHPDAVISYDNPENPNDTSGFIDHIMTPVISVAGVGENTDKFLTQLLLKEYLEKNKCKTLLISSRNNSSLLRGVYPFPDFMNHNISTERKIIMYNRYVKKLEKENNPDMIIAGVQGSILPCISINARNFELHPYAVFNAVKPSYSVVCLYGNHVPYEYLHEIRQTMKYKYGTDVDFFHRSTTMQDLDMVLGKSAKVIETICANMDETAYIYDDISQIGDIILKKY